MRRLSTASAFRRTTPLAVLLTLALAARLAHGQSPLFGNLPPGGSTTPAPTPAPAPAAPASSPVLARVEGRDITQAQFDQLAAGYLPRVRAQMGSLMTPEVMRQARQNVFDELVRREIVRIEAERARIAPSEADVDTILSRDPMLATNGRFDPARLAAFKTDPRANYRQILPRLREMAAAARFEQQLRTRLAPGRDSLRAEFERREATAQFQYFALAPRDVPLEAESDEADWRAYHAAHAAEFRTPSQMRLLVRRWPLPGAADTARTAAEAAAMTRARATADSLRARTLPDSTAGVIGTAWFTPGAGDVPTVGRSAELLAAVTKADTVASEHVLGPFALPEAVVVASVAGRQPASPMPYAAARRLVKPRADREKRQREAEQARRDWYAAHLDRFRGPRVEITRLTLRMADYRDRDIQRPEVERWYKAHGQRLFGLPDTSRAWLPPMSDSLWRVARRAMFEEERDGWIAGTSNRLATGLATARDVRAFARANGAIAETLSFHRASAPDSLFPQFLVDSLLATAAARRGQVQGPRALGAYSAVWRVERADSAFVPPFEAARTRLEPGFLEEKRQRDDDEARTWFDAHRADYTLPVRWVTESVTVPLPPPDSVRVPEAAVRAAYERDRARYQVGEQVRARHILLSTREGGPERASRAKARAESLLVALRAGADFAETAKRFSEEPSAANSGGDLGWFGRGRMVPEFERAAFALAPGQLSPVTETAFGYHIIKLEERRPAGTRPFAEVREEILSGMKTAKRDSLARRRAESLRRAVAPGRDLARLAAPYGGWRTNPPFAATEAPVWMRAEGGAGMAPEFERLAPGQWLPRVGREASGYVVARVREKQPPRPAEFDEVRAKVRQDVDAAKRREKFELKVTALRSALAGGATLDSLAAPYGGLKDSGPVRRSLAFVQGLGQEPRLVERAFGLAAGGASDTVQVAQGVVWLHGLGVQRPDAAAFAAAEPALAQELLRQRLEAWFAKRRQALRVEILKSEFRKGPAIAAR